MGGAPGDGVGRVGALLAGAHVGRGSCRALRWTVQQDRTESGQGGLTSWREVGVLGQKRSGNKIDLILGRNERGGAQAVVVS